MIRFEKDGLVKDLLAYGELALANRISSLSEQQLEEIGKLASKHIGGGGYISKHIVLGAIEFFEGQLREPKRKRRDLTVYQTDSHPTRSGFMDKLKIVFSRKS